MDWSKTQLAEIRYFCTSTRSRTPKILVGLPLKLQLGFVLIIFSYYHITEFQISDIKAFYKLLYTPHFKSDRLRVPSPARIAKALEQLDKDPNCQINVQCLEEDRYRIFWVSPIYADDYVKELDYGYERGYVQYFMEEHTC